MTIYLGIDDTDTRESRGTGRLARSLAAELAKNYPIAGVTRHQLFVHDAIPYTSHNSAAVIHVGTSANGCGEDLFATCREMMISDFIKGSDPRYLYRCASSDYTRSHCVWSPGKEYGADTG